LFVPNINSDFQTASRELWVSDGTAANTQMVKDLTPGRIGTTINDLVPVGQNVLFSANVPTANGQVYLSDGTDARTIRLTDPALLGLSAAGILTIARSADGGTVYFFGSNTSDELVIVRSDGTVAGTEIVASNVPDLGSAEIGVAGNRLYYQSFTVASGWELPSVDLTTGSPGWSRTSTLARPTRLPPSSARSATACCSSPRLRQTARSCGAATEPKPARRWSRSWRTAPRA
jgi:ELWxxDGT repeat protein